MNKKLQHIFRSLAITFVMCGFLAHLIVPFSSQAQKTAFTRWLDHNIVSSGNESEVKLRNTIRELPEQTSDFLVLVKEASELVSKNKDHFKIAVSNAGQGKAQDKTDWLIDQWNIFQDQKSGFNSVLFESFKSLLSWTPQSLHYFYSGDDSGKDQNHSRKEIFYDSITAIAATLQPLVSGISINAP